MPRTIPLSYAKLNQIYRKEKATNCQNPTKDAYAPVFLGELVVLLDEAGDLVGHPGHGAADLLDVLPVLFPLRQPLLFLLQLPEAKTCDSSILAP